MASSVGFGPDHTACGVDDVDGLSGNLTEKHSRRNGNRGLRKNNRSKRWSTVRTKAPDSLGIPGLQYVVVSRGSKVRRIVWTIILVLAFIATVAQIGDRITYFLSCPTSINLEIDYSYDGITFPKVVICNVNNFERSKIETYPSVNLLLLRFLRLVSEDALTPEQLEELENMDYTALIKELAHTPQEMFVTIDFGDEELTVANVTPVYTTYGYCYQLNAGSFGEEPLRVIQAGKSYGLRLTLNTQQEEYYFQETGRYSAGFIVQILDQDAIPAISELGFALQPGTENFVVIEKEETFNLGPPYGVCGERNLELYDSYSRQKCMLECITDKVVQQCGCKMPFMPGNNSFCSPITVTTCGTLSYDRALSELRGCKCPVNCQYTTYDYRISTAAFPADFWIDTYTKYPDLLNDYFNATGNITRSYLTNNFVAVDMFFSGITTTTTRQQVAYTGTALLSDIGGSLGLYLGGTMLTLFQLADLLAFPSKV